MKRLLYLLLFNLVFGPVISQTCEFAPGRDTDVLNQKICSESLKADLGTLYKYIKQIHPDPYRRVSKSSLDSAYTEAISACQTPQSLYSFSIIVNQFLSSLKDSHTFLNAKELLNYRFLKRYYLPLELSNIEDKYYLSDSWNHVLPRGAQIISINKKDIHNYFKDAFNLAPQESFSLKSKHEVAVMLLGSVINLKNPQKRNKFVYALGGDTLSKWVEFPRMFKVYKHIYKVEDQAPVTYKIKSQKAYLYISTFSPGSTNKFKRELDGFFETIIKDGVDTLIIDLRNNTGGFIMLQEYLMSFLVKNKKDQYPANYIYKRSKYDRFSEMTKLNLKFFKRAAQKFYPDGTVSKEYDFYLSPMGTVDTVLNNPTLKNLYNKTYTGSTTLMLNGGSMSASVNFGAWFMMNNIGKIVGSCALGTTSGTFANTASVGLPKTGISVSISTLKIDPLWTGDAEDCEVCPEQIYVPTPMSLKRYKDPLLHEIWKP